MRTYQVYRDSRVEQGYSVELVLDSSSPEDGLPSDEWIDGQRSLGISYFMVEWEELE